MAELPDSSDHPEVSDVGVDFERLIADLSSRFINLPPGEVDRGIEAGLRRVSELLGIDYSVLWQWSDTPSKVLNPTHFYSREGGEQPSEPMDQDLFPWALQEVMAGRLVAVSS